MWGNLMWLWGKVSTARLSGLEKVSQICMTLLPGARDWLCSPACGVSLGPDLPAAPHPAAGLGHWTARAQRPPPRRRPRPGGLQEGQPRSC